VREFKYGKMQGAINFFTNCRKMVLWRFFTACYNHSLILQHK